MKSVMQHSFAQVPHANVSRSQFNRSHGHKTTIDADYLYPVLVDEVLPGDTLKCSANFFARMATPIYPIMDNLFIDSFFFFVPYRLLWTNWEKFLGAQDNPGDSIDFTIPQMVSTTATGYSSNSLHDYLGIPPGVPDVSHSSLFHRAYNLIWNDWFRDQNLQNSITVDVDDGPDSPTDYVLQKRGKRHDYFTACLPWPQKGDTAVTLPLGTKADVKYGALIGGGTDREDQWVQSDTNASGGGEWHYGPNATTDSGSVGINTTHPLYADLSNATAATINAIRLAVATQQFLERDARGGTRINEIILSHFGVVTLDHRVQRPEYLGGGSVPIQINAVPQTSETNTTAQGTMAAFGTAFAGNHGFTKAFTEHGCIIGLVNVRADLTYQQGLHRMFSRSTRYDFFWPEFQNIGEQAVLQQEIELTDPAGGTNDDVWGYIGRFDEYRFMPSRISGTFRSSHALSLDPWHLSEELSSPALDSTFIPSNTPMTRVQAVTSQPDFILDCHFGYFHTRPMSIYGEPGLARF